MTEQAEKLPLSKLIRREWAIPYGLFLLLIFFEAMDSNAFAPIIAQIRDEFQLTATQVGLYSGAGALFGLLVTVPVGELIRRRGYRTAGGTMAAFIFAGAMVSFVAPVFLVLILGRILTLSGTRGCLLIGQAGGISVAPKQVRNTALSLLIAILSIGGAIGAYVVGGLIGGVHGWRAVMLTIAVSTVVLFIIYLLFMRMPEGAEERHAEKAAADKSLPNVYKIWPLYGLGLAYALSTAGMTVNSTFASVVAQDSWNLDAKFTGGAVGLGQIISLPFVILSGILADKYLPRRVVITLFVLLSMSGAFVQLASLELAATAGGPTLFTIGLVFCFVGKAGGGLLYACVPDYLKQGMSLGPAYAVLSLVAMSGYVLEPILAGMIRDATGGWHLVFLTFGLGPLLGLLLIRQMKVQ